MTPPRHKPVPRPIPALRRCASAPSPRLRAAFLACALVFPATAALRAQTLEQGLDHPSFVGPFTNTAVSHNDDSAIPSGLWRYDAANSYEDVDSIVSVLPNRSLSRLRTTVQGPALVSFAWKINAATSGDTLRFFSRNDNAMIASNWGNAWSKRTFQVDFGEQPVEWVFDRLSSLPVADGRAWIDQLVVTPMPNVPELQEAVDNSAYDIFSTDWTKVDREGAVNGSVARSGPILPNKSSSMLLQVQGPATVSFNWAMESDPDGYAETVFKVNGQESAYLSSPQPLHRRTFELGPGSHTLKFVFELSYQSEEYEGANEAQVDNLVVDSYGPNPALAEAVDRPGGVYSRNWQYQTGVTHDGSDAATVYSPEADVWKHLYIELPDGPGLLTFWSKTEIEAAYGYLFFRLDGAFVDIGGGANTQNGITDWVKTELNLGQRSNRVLEAVLVRYNTAAEVPQLTRAYLDQVVFIPGATNYQPDLAIARKGERLRGVGRVNRTGTGQVAQAKLRPRRLGEKFVLQSKNLSPTDGDKVRLRGRGDRKHFRVMFIVPYEGKLYDYSKPFLQGKLTTLELDPGATEQFEVWVTRTRKGKRRVHNYRIIGTSTTDNGKIDVVRTRLRLDR